jgi:hypothetical protein
MSSVAMARPGAVDHAADRAVERDVGEVVLRGLDLLLVLLRLVAQRHDLGMAVERVRIEGDLGVEAAQLAVGGDDQRVDLQHLHVLRRRRVELGDELLPACLARSPERPSALATCAVMGHRAGRGIDGEGVDLLGRVVGDLLDVHAAFGRDDEGDAAVARSTSIER